MPFTDLPLPDSRSAEIDASLPIATKPLVKGVRADDGTYTYEVQHEGITATLGPWRDAYEHAQVIARIQAMVLDALGGASRG